jgi:hypothetical protein
MKEDWERVYKAALMERNPALQQSKIDEAHKAITLRLRQTEALNNERHKLENAINILNILRGRI